MLTVGGPLAGVQEDVVLTVAAAADLTPAFEDIGELFTVEPGVSVELTAGAG